MATAKLGTLTLDFEAKIAQFTSALETVQARTNKVVDAIQKQGSELKNLRDTSIKASEQLEKQASVFEKLSDQSEKLSKSLSLAKKAFLGIATGATVKKFVDLSDSFVDLNSRMNLTIGDADKAKEMFNALSENAKLTYTSLQDTAEMFLSNSTALSELGYSYETQLMLTQGLNNAFVVSGAKGKDVESVMNAISNAFATGTLKGNDLNTVLSKGGRIAESLAKSFGVTTLELKALGAEGKLGIHEVVKAITDDFDNLENEAEKLPTTVGDVFVRLKNATFEFVGGINEVLNANATLASAFESLVGVVDSFNNSLKSGQFKTELDAIVAQFGKSTKEMADQGDSWLDYSISLFKEMGTTFLESVKTMPMNFKAAFGLIGQMLAEFMLKTWEKVKYWGKRLMTPSAWLDGGQLDVDLKVNLNAITDASNAKYTEILNDYKKKSRAYYDEVAKGAKQLEDFKKNIDTTPKQGEDNLVNLQKQNEAVGKTFEEMLGGYDKAQAAANRFNKAQEEIRNNQKLTDEQKKRLFAENQKRYDEELASLNKVAGSTKKVAKANKEKTKSFEELYAQFDKGQTALNNYDKQMNDILTSSANFAQKQELIRLTTNELNKELAKLKAVSPYQELLGDYDKLQAVQNEHLRKLEDIKHANISQIEQAELMRLETEKYNKEVNELKGIKSYETLMAQYDKRLAAQIRYKEVLEEIENAEATLAQKEILRAKAQQEHYEATRTFWEEQRDSLQNNLTAYDDMDLSSLNNFTNAFSNAFSDIVTGTKSVGDAMRDMLSTLVQNTINAVSQMIAQWLALQAVQGSMGMGGGGYAAVGGGIFGNIASFQSPTIPLIGMSHAGFDEIPKTGTWLLEKGERVTTAKTSAKLDKTLEQIMQNNNYNTTRNTTVTQQINVNGKIDNRTANQIALESDRRMKKADRRLGNG